MVFSREIKTKLNWWVQAIAKLWECLIYVVFVEKHIWKFITSLYGNYISIHVISQSFYSHFSIEAINVLGWNFGFFINIISYFKIANKTKQHGLTINFQISIFVPPEAIWNQRDFLIFSGGITLDH